MAIAFDTTGSTSMTAGATSSSIDITAAAVGATVYVWIAIGPAPTGTITITGWTDVFTQAEDGTSARYALLRRVKQSGDTTFTVSWTNSAKGTLSWASYTGLDSVTPDEGGTLATNGTTSRTAVPTPSGTPTAANRWAVGFFSARTSTSLNKPITWTPDAALNERIDVDNNAAASAPWMGHEIADSNAAVTQASHSYTGTHNAAESHDGSAILFLIPASVAVTIPIAPARRARATWPRLTIQPAIRSIAPVRAQVNPPIPVQAVEQTRRLRGMFYRRGHAWQAVRAQVNPPVPVQEIAQPRRLRAWLIRRGRVCPPIRDQVNPPFPVQEIVQPRRLRGWLIRRGKTVNTVPAQVVVAPPAYPPAEVVQPRRLRGLLPRRGKTVNVVPAQVVVTPPTYTPGEVVQPRRLRGLLSRRGKSTTVYPTPIAPAGVVRRLTRLVGFLRRDRVTPVTPAQDVLIQGLRRDRPIVPPLIRRGRVVRVIGVSTPAVPPPYIPQVVRAKWAKPFFRRGRVVVYLFPGNAANPCVTVRPSTGRTGRPGTGTTTRPGTGLTAYSRAMTARPNTGSTDDPC